MNYRHLIIGLALGASLITMTYAHAQQEVNVYSYRQPFLVEPLFDAFSDKTGIQVNVVFAKEGLIERLKHEGANSPADVLLTVDIGTANDAVVADVVQSVQNETIEANIPAQFRHPDGLWFALTTRARIAVTSKERVAEGELASYEALMDPKWQGRICSRSGKHVYNIALLAAQMIRHGEEQAERWLRGVKENLARKPQGNDRAQVKAIKEGECDVALINSYYVGNMLEDEEQREWVTAVDLVFPNQDSTGTHVNISAMSLTKSAPHRENAIRLMEFLSDDQAQQIYAEQNFEYPVKPDVPWSELLTSWGQYKVDDLPLADIADHREAAFKLVDQVGFDQ